MDTYNADLDQTIKWVQGKAETIQTLITGYQTWLDNNNTLFWSNFYSSVFNLDTANTFGLKFWCIILGVPSSLVDLTPISNAFAFGVNRENFKYVAGPFDKIQNDNFQDDLLYWNSDSSQGVKGEITIISDNTSGNGSGKIAQFGIPSISGDWDILSQSFPALPDDYTFSYIVKMSSDYAISGGDTTNHRINIYDADTGTLIASSLYGDGTATTDWATYSHTVTVPTGTKNIRVDLLSQLSAGTMDIAEFKFYSAAAAAPTNPEETGGNFFGTAGALTGIEEVRFLLKLRYAALVSNGNFVFINRMLNWIINKGDKKQSLDDNIVIVDSSALDISNPITENYYWEYRIGKNVTLGGNQISTKLLSILNERSYGCVPSVAGVPYLFVQES